MTRVHNALQEKFEEYMTVIADNGNLDESIIFQIQTKYYQNILNSELKNYLKNDLLLDEILATRPLITSSDSTAVVFLKKQVRSG